MSDKRLGVLIAGFDGFGTQDHQRAMYLPAFATHPDFELVAAVDCHGRAGAAAVADEYGIDRPAGLDEALADSRVDVVSIAARPEKRAECIAAALHAGKHVLADKPLAATAAEARELAELADAQHVLLVPAHHQRLHGAVQSAANAVRAGRVGLPWNLQADFIVAGGDPAPVGELTNLGLYPVDAVSSILGLRIRRVHAITQRYWHGDADDFAVLLLDHDHGVTSTITCGRTAPICDVAPAGLAVHRYRISGSHGVLLVDARKPNITLRTSGGSTARWTGPDTTRRLLDVLSRGIHTGRAAITAWDAVHTLQVAEAAARSTALGRPVDINDNGGEAA
jgi:predicted dehydrogenase